MVGDRGRSVSGRGCAGNISVPAQTNTVAVPDRLMAASASLLDHRAAERGACRGVGAGADLVASTILDAVAHHLGIGDAAVGEGLEAGHRSRRA